MIYRKTFSPIQSKVRRVTISDFSGGMNVTKAERVLPNGYARLSYNYEPSDGSLNGSLGLGLANYTIPNGTALRVYHYKKFDRVQNLEDDRLIVYSSNKKLYFAKIGGVFSELVGVTFDKPPESVLYRLNGEDVIIFSQAEHALVVWNGVDAPITLDAAPRLTSLCVHYERLFATGSGDRSAVWFSDDLDVTNWNVSLSEAGFIEMADEGGGLLKVLSFNGYVYIFRTYGIARITAAADQTDYRVTRLFTSSGKIYPRTVTICGDRIIFLAEDGLYAFDGLDTHRIADGVVPALKKRQVEATGCFYNGKYYLACGVDFSDETSAENACKNNSLLIYDIAKAKTILMRGFSTLDMAVVLGESESTLLFVLEGNSRLAKPTSDGKLLGSSLYKQWKTPVFDLNEPDKMKQLVSMSVHTTAPISVNFFSDIGTRSLTFVSGLTTRRIGLRGKEFRMEINATDNGIVSRPQLRYEIRS